MPGHILMMATDLDKTQPPIEQRQLQQVAFKVPSHNILIDYYNPIKQTDIPFTLKDNQMSLSIYSLILIMLLWRFIGI